MDKIRVYEALEVGNSKLNDLENAARNSLAIANYMEDEINEHHRNLKIDALESRVKLLYRLISKGIGTIQILNTLTQTLKELSELKGDEYRRVG
jgi:hypothetical protein